MKALHCEIETNEVWSSLDLYDGTLYVLNGIAITCDRNTAIEYLRKQGFSRVEAIAYLCYLEQDHEQRVNSLNKNRKGYAKA